jgi:hypothetical protein
MFCTELSQAMPSFLSERKQTTGKLELQKGKKVNCGKWTVLIMQNSSVKCIALIAKHSVAPSDDIH